MSIRKQTYDHKSYTTWSDSTSLGLQSITCLQLPITLLEFLHEYWGQEQKLIEQLSRGEQRCTGT